jgi:hypothetical protein
MKKSAKIRLVLVTAVLASCNREIVPSMGAAGETPDPTLTAPPTYVSTPLACTCQVQENRPDSLYEGDNSFYVHPNYAVRIYFPGDDYRRGSIWKSHHFVVRGGFGKAAVASPAS